MQEHPIPQDITGYRFHIIGSMTLKQFGEIFLGVIIAVIIYSTNLTGIIKWPLVLFFVGLGAAAAFIPIEERPLDHWIATFIKVIYKPTKFFWRKEGKIPEVFLYKRLTTIIIQEPEIDLTPAKRQRIKEYLSSVPEKSHSSTDFSTQELVRMQEILSSFKTTKINVEQKIIHHNSTKQKPSLNTRVRTMRKPQVKDEFSIIYEESQPKKANILSPKKQSKKKTTLSNDQVAQNIEIPEQEMIKLQREDDKIENIRLANAIPKEQTFIAWDKQTSSQNSKTIDSKKIKNVNFNSNLPFPTKPTEPNKLVGMVLGKNNDLLTNSIVEVQTPNGQIKRAVKTNALGQFFIATPLKNGNYNIVVEKDNYIFRPIHIKIDNTIIQPIEIRSEN